MILYNAYVRYAWAATLQGNIEIAWRFLEQVPINFIPNIPLIDIFVLRDRVYGSRGYISDLSGQPPAFPFDSIEVVDVEALRLAAEFEEKQRLAAHRESQTFHNNNTPQQWKGNQQEMHQDRRNSLNQWNQPPNTHPWNQAPTTNQWNQSSSIHSNRPPVANQVNLEENQKMMR